MHKPSTNVAALKFEKRLRDDPDFRDFIYDSHADESLQFIDKVRSFERAANTGRIKNVSMWRAEVDLIWKLFLADDALLKINADTTLLATVQAQMADSCEEAPPLKLDIFRELYMDQCRLLSEQLLSAYESKRATAEKKGMRKVSSLESVGSRIKVALSPELRSRSQDEKNKVV